MITIVVGKPGSGKSYHIVRHIAKYLTTLSKKETIERKIYTNVSLNLDELQAYFNRRAISIDVRSIVKLLEEADLKLDRDKLRPGDVKEEKRGNRLHTVVNPFSPAFFWNRFPDNALIVIDEIQKYIGSVKEYGESEEQSLVEYFSLHRHKKHDWIFLTQAITSLSVVVRRVSEKVIEVYNSKSTTLPFPFSIPVADIFTLLRGFGIENQVYRVRTGVLQGTYRVDFEGPIEVVKMSPEIFRLYQTHTLLGEDEKGASVVDSELPFDLGPGAWWRAILWFLGQHGFRFLILGSIFFGFTYGCLRVMGVDPFFWVKDIRLPFLSRRDVEIDRSLFDLPTIELDPLSQISGESNENEKVKGIKAPISLTVFADYVKSGDECFRVGDVVPWNGKRITTISPLFGVKYENATFVYFRDFQLVRAGVKWLRESYGVQSDSDFKKTDSGAVLGVGE